MFNDCCEYNNDVTRPTGLVNAPAAASIFYHWKSPAKARRFATLLATDRSVFSLITELFNGVARTVFALFSEWEEAEVAFFKRKFISIANRGDLFPVICANEDVESQKQIIRRTLAIEIFVRWEGNRRSRNGKRFERPASLIFVRSRTNFSLRSIYLSYRTNCYLESIRRYNVFLFMRSRGCLVSGTPLQMLMATRWFVFSKLH